ncbi:hypothetical protein NW766_004030 [Fusarium irregulare]|uniref:Xylanolytic transcriptional activator regulatory domain-containing protein n=1 Tax=Fusarium irregulare TaxID=2494466 RepID=A0A9W8PVD2_9HYPO|nr:hypothetical protein NW766_004030 [Fusarium irregulare]
MDQSSISRGLTNNGPAAPDDSTRRAMPFQKQRSLNLDASGCTNRSIYRIPINNAPSDAIKTGPVPTVVQLNALAHPLVLVRDPRSPGSESSSHLNKNLLRDLSQRPTSTPGSNVHFPVTPGAFVSLEANAASTVGFESSDDESALGGDSVIAQQTTFASELLEHAVERTSLHDVSPKMWEALANLRQIAELQSRQSISHGPRFPLQQPLPQGGLGQLKMPPMDVVVSLLKRAREDFTDATFIIVNVGLYYLFLEQHALTMDNKALKDEFASHLHTSRVNLETGLANMSLFMSIKIETVQALLMGTLYAIDVCRPSVAWHLNSAAAQMCQTAGFHRKDHSMRNPEEAGIRAILFWYIYTTDKALAIRLGRAPLIQDWEIDIPRTFHFEGILSIETKAVASMWLSAATLQGQVYEQLFCPAALAQPPAVLAERARMLAAKCREVEAEAHESRGLAIASLEKIGASPLVDVHVKGDEVQLLSTMTLIYRAIPAPEGSSKTSSAEDLRLLSDFSTSIGETSDASETMQKLSRLCQVMSNVAALYVEAKSQQQEDQTMAPIGDEFDVYLSQLGFMPVMDPNMNTAGGDPNAAFQDNSQVAQMADWMSGSRNLLGLLEQDISQLGGPQWPPM